MIWTAQQKGKGEGNTRTRTNKGIHTNPEGGFGTMKECKAAVSPSKRSAAVAKVHRFDHF